MIPFLIINRRRLRRLRRLVHYDTDMKGSLRRATLFLSLIVAAHVLAMQMFEGMSPSDGLWLTLTTVTTVGYGDLSAATAAGRTATVLLLYLGGIWVLAKTAGDYLDFRNERLSRKLRGEWRWNMAGHILILNTPDANGEQYFVRLIEQFRASERYRDHPVQILTSEFPNGLPESLRGMPGVVHYHGRADDVDPLRAVGVEAADLIVVLAKDETDQASDGRTFDILHRLSELGAQGTLLAECVADRNRARLKKAGADVVIRPMRAYPEMIVRAFVAPGSEQIIENMFTSASDEYVRFDIPLAGLTWREIVCALITYDIGTAVAYVSAQDGSLQCNPPANDSVNATAVIVMVREEKTPSAETVSQVLTQGAGQCSPA